MPVEHPDPTVPALPLSQPASRTDLFVSFTLLALQGFGGVLAVVQRELVDRKRWMTREQFVEEWAVAQIMPGPIISERFTTFGPGMICASSSWRNGPWRRSCPGRTW